jgi:hypothetical protein
MPWEDPIIEEVRKVRDAYAKQFNYDLDRIFCDLKEKERLSGHVLVSSPQTKETSIPANEHTK